MGGQRSERSGGPGDKRANAYDCVFRGSRLVICEKGGCRNEMVSMDRFYDSKGGKN